MNAYRMKQNSTHLEEYFSNYRKDVLLEDELENGLKDHTKTQVVRGKDSQGRRTYEEYSYQSNGWKPVEKITVIDEDEIERAYY